MIDIAQLSDLLGALYDCALDPDGWSRVPVQLAAALGAERCFLHTRDNATGACGVLGVTANLLDAGVTKYADHYFKQDVFAPGAARRGVGVASISQDIVGDEEMWRSEFYQDFCRHLGIFHGACAFIPVEDQFVGAIGIGKPRQEAAFEAEDRATLQLLLPHLSRAMQLQRRLSESRDGRRVAFGALEAMRCGVLIVDPSSRVLFANPVAEALIRRGDAIVARNGRLRTAATADEARLHRAIGAAAAAAEGNPFLSGGTLVLQRAGARPLSLLVCPMPTDAAPDMRARRPVIIFVDDPDDATSPPAVLLQTLYALSPAEARLGAALVEGKRLQDYAEDAGISIHTARTQLRHLFAKTGHDRQSDFIRDALSSLVLRMQRPNG